MPETRIITIKYTPATPIPLQGMGETAPGAWQHHTYPLPPPSTLLGALAAPHLRHAKGATRQEKLRNALAHAGISLKAARAAYATINGEILLPAQTALISLSQIIGAPEEEVKKGLETSYPKLPQHSIINVKLATRTETPDKQVDEAIGGLFQRNYMHIYTTLQEKIELHLDIEVKNAPSQTAKGTIRLPRTPARYTLAGESPLIETLDISWRISTGKALLYVATPILLQPRGETPLQLVQRYKEEIARAARLQPEDLEGPYPLIKGAKPEIRPLFPGFNQADRRREPLYTALMPGAAYLAQGIGPNNWQDIYTAEVGEKTYLGYGVIIPVSIR